MVTTTAKATDWLGDKKMSPESERLINKFNLRTRYEKLTKRTILSDKAAYTDWLENRLLQLEDQISE